MKTIRHPHLLILTLLALVAPRVPAPAALVHQWTFNNGTANDSVGTAHGTLCNGATVSGGQLRLDGVNDYFRTGPLAETLSNRTLMVWVTLSNLTQQAGSALTLENPTGNDVFDGIIYGEQVTNRWINGSDNALRWNSEAATTASPAETSLGQVFIAIVYGDPTSSDDNIKIYRNGALYADYTPAWPLITYPAGVADVLIGVRHSDLAGGTGTATGFDEFLAGSIDEARIYDTALTAGQIAGVASGQTKIELATEAANPVFADGAVITNATLNASVIVGANFADVYFQWGTNQLYGSSTPIVSLAPGIGAVNVSHSLTGLAAGVACHYRVVASNHQGVVYRGVDRVFGAPLVTLNGPSTLTNECSGEFNDTGVSVIDPTSTMAVAAGGNHSLALRSDGTVAAWGQYYDNVYGDLPMYVPAGLSDVVAIAGGPNHNVALRSDGTVVAWGFNSAGETDVPAGLSNVVAIAAGGSHSLALRSDGTIAAWGYNGNGQTNVPTGLSNVVAIAAGGGFNVALRADGTVTAWGFNFNGQTNVPAGLSNVVAIAAGGSHSLALRRDGTVVAWGRNLEGQTTVPGGFVNVAAGRYHSLALKGDGTLSAWGAGTTGTGIDPDFGQSIVPGGLGGVAAIAVGEAHCVALRSNGTVVAWGNNDFGQTTVPEGLNGVVAISAGRLHSLALKGDGTVLAWGVNGGGDDYGQARVPTGLSSVVAIAAGGYHNLALKRDGTVFAWGLNTQGQTNVPAGLYGVVAVFAGLGHSLALKSDGTVAAWGWNSSGQTNVPPGLSDVVALSAGFDQNLALKRDGTVVAWGSNNYEKSAVPPGLTDVVAIAAGWEHGLAVKSDGTMVSWGRNQYGQTAVPIPFGTFLGNILVTDDVNPAVPGNYTRSYTATTPLGAVNGNSRALVLLPGGLPGVSSLPVTGAGPTSVTLQANVNPNDHPTEVWFEWGASTNYTASRSRQAIGSGNTDVLVGEPLTGLTAQGLPYHYRVVAENCGGTVFGADQVFMLPAYPSPGLVSVPANQMIPQGGSSTLIPLTLVNGTDISVFSSNPALVPNSPSNLLLSGSGSNQTLLVVPVAGQSGEALITVTVSDGEQTTRSSFLVIVPPAPGDFTPLFITSLQSTQQQTVHLEFTDGGAGVTNLNIEYRPALDTNWTTQSASVINLGGGNYEASITGLTNDTGFFRVRAVRLVTAQLGEDGLTVEGSPGTNLLSLTFTAPLQGWVTYALSQVGLPTTTNMVYVNGTTAVISVPVGANPEPGTLRNFTVTLLDTTAGQILGNSQTSFSVEDPDSEWQGTFGSGNALFGFVMKLENQNGSITSGTLYSAEYGVLPTNGHPVSVTYWSNYFSATALEVPVSATSTLFNQPALLSLTLLATNGPPGQSVTPSSVTGPATLVLRTPAFPELDTTNHGSFVLFKTPPRASTNEANLVIAP